MTEMEQPSDQLEKYWQQLQNLGQERQRLVEYLASINEQIDNVKDNMLRLRQGIKTGDMHEVLDNG